ncbi:PepSY domain-containing protein [Pseudomonas matsuisoli]|uniref:Oxidoreductase n=1 Tax=Pseudomonas matsuisoli TaxID=1515666 RepID=A0A917V0S4_9PSED|nr:sulfite reductase flavoprotein subunit alpha [Pseudomonas matsuisoli]GGK08350.1 oxidoreductase [Pseudomonas matsuisoli]
MFKKVMFQLHWLFGITAGLVLSLMGITGALYTFQEEILELINPQVLQVEAKPEGVLPAPVLVGRLEHDFGKTVSSLIVNHEGGASRVFFQPPPGERRGPMRYFDPYTGQLLGEPAGEGFFSFVLQLHRFLAMGQTGRQITGACTLMLIFFCLSGLYLRWPRRALSWRTWLTFDWSKKGRAFNWDLHAIAGTWCLVFYLLAGLTGLFWSYDWYRQGATRLLSGEAAEQRLPRGAGMTEAPDYAMVWRRLQEIAGPELAAWSIRPSPAGQPLTISYRLKDAAHARAFDRVDLDAKTGEMVRHERYADKAFGEQMLASVYALHTGEYFGVIGRVLMMLASLSMPIFFVTGWLLYLDRRRKKKGIRENRELAGKEAKEGWLIGFASQSGLAEQLAWMTAGQLQAAGFPVQVRPLAQLDEHALRKADKALFVISTFGDGEAPDSARSFERRLLGQALGLDKLQFSVLGLGDRQYEQFCEFARKVNRWLTREGASHLFEPVEVDNGDARAIADWQAQLSQLTGTAAVPRFEQAYSLWTLRERVHLNPESQGGPTYLIRLEGPEIWNAGDVLQIQPRHGDEHVRGWLSAYGLDADAAVVVDGQEQPLFQALASRELPQSFEHLVGLHAQALLDALAPLGTRDYSIASIMADGALELIVRQERFPDGGLGLGSGWLTVHLQPDAALVARVRSNSSFHVPEGDRPIILIGNGTGLAGLRSLLKARIAAGHSRNWLLFGERNAAHDFYCEDEVRGWLSDGGLARLDLAFSRDQAERVYVQDRLRDAADELRAWVAEGASIYVCGSLNGMAGGVDSVLRAVLGDAIVDDLVEQGRYRRDVY